MTYLKQLSVSNMKLITYHQKDPMKQLINDCNQVNNAMKNIIWNSELSLERIELFNKEMEALLVYYSNLFEKVKPPTDLPTTKRIIQETELLGDTEHCKNHTLNNDIPMQDRLVMQHLIALRLVLSHDGDLTEELIKEAHRVLMKGIKDDEGLDVHEGHYRTEDVAAKHTVFQSPYLVPESMTTLIKDFNEAVKDTTIDTCLLAGWLMVQFVQIHPFNDGNGRMSRLLFQYALRKRGMHLIVPLLTPKDVKEFKDCLKRYQRVTGLEKYGNLWAYSAGCVAETVRTFLKYHV